jgi:hypothetical protein
MLSWSHPGSSVAGPDVTVLDVDEISLLLLGLMMGDPSRRVGLSTSIFMVGVRQ